MVYLVIIVGWPLLTVMARVLTLFVYIKHGLRQANMTYGLWMTLALIYGLIVPVYYLL